MSDDTQDIFGKIDALRGKRAGFGAPPPRPKEEEFPLLTDVVPDAPPPTRTATPQAAPPRPAPASPPPAPLPRAAAPVAAHPGPRSDERAASSVPAPRQPAPARPVAGAAAKSAEDGRIRLDATGTAPSPALEPDVRQALALELEARLGDLFIRQQARLEEVIRRVVREELERRLGPGGRASGG